MSALDIIIGIGLVLGAVGGFRLGFIARSSSWLGLALGIVVGSRLLPPVARSFEGSFEVSMLAPVPITATFMRGFLSRTTETAPVAAGQAPSRRARRLSRSAGHAW